MGTFALVVVWGLGVGTTAVFAWKGYKVTSYHLALQALRSGVPNRQVPAAARMAAVKYQRTVRDLVAALAGASPEVRAAIATSLGVLGSAAAAAALEVLLMDGDIRVCQSAARALNSKHWTSHPLQVQFAEYWIGSEDWARLKVSDARKGAEAVVKYCEHYQYDLGSMCWLWPDVSEMLIVAGDTRVCPALVKILLKSSENPGSVCPTIPKWEALKVIHRTLVALRWSPTGPEEQAADAALWLDFIAAARFGGPAVRWFVAAWRQADEPLTHRLAAGLSAMDNPDAAGAVLDELAKPLMAELAVKPWMPDNDMKARLERYAKLLNAVLAYFTRVRNPVVAAWLAEQLCGTSCPCSDEVVRALIALGDVAPTAPALLTYARRLIGDFKNASKHWAFMEKDHVGSSLAAVLAGIGREALPIIEESFEKEYSTALNFALASALAAIRSPEAGSLLLALLRTLRTDRYNDGCTAVLLTGLQRAGNESGELRETIRQEIAERVQALKNALEQAIASRTGTAHGLQLYLESCPDLIGQGDLEWIAAVRSEYREYREYEVRQVYRDRSCMEYSSPPDFGDMSPWEPEQILVGTETVEVTRRVGVDCSVIKSLAAKILHARGV